MKDEKNFGAFVAELRKEKGFTQLQLAELIHVTDKAVSRWENNGGYPDIDTMNKLCDIFDVTMDELYAAKRLNQEKIRRMKIIKRVALMIGSFLFAAAIIFGYYFVYNYNSVKFYTLYIDIGNFDIRGASYLEAKTKNLLQISKIEYLGEGKIENEYIEIYEKDGMTIYSGVTKDDLFIEISEVVNIDELYLKIIYTKNSESIQDDYKIENTLRYSNNDFVNKKIEPVKQDENILDDEISKLSSLNYELYSYPIYLKEMQNNKIKSKKYFNIAIKYYNEFYEYENGKSFNIDYYLDSDNIHFQLQDKNFTILEEFNYMYNKDKLTCLTKRCSKWDDVIKETKEEIVALESIFN